MLEFNHGVPNTPYFLIALPYRGEPMGDKVKMGTKEDPFIKAELTDPKTKVKCVVEIHSMWRFDMSSPELITSFAKLAYGLTGPQLLTYMKQRYPHFNYQVEFLLLKKL
jgi:hypothetical protein